MIYELFTRRIWVFMSFFTMTDLSDQLALTELVKLKAYGAYIARREQQWLIQFLIALHSDFEGLKGLILHHSPLPSVDSVVNSYWLKKYVFSLILKRKLFLLIILMCYQYFLNYSLIIKISLSQELPLTSAIYISRKVIGRLNVLSWDIIINRTSNLELESLTTSHNLKFIDHLRVTNHHSLILQQ